MKFKIFFPVLLLVSIVAIASNAQSLDQSRYLYGGLSSKKDGNTGESAGVIGFLSTSDSGILGFDIAKEGSYLDSTGRDASRNQFRAKWRPSYSLNGLFGVKLNSSNSVPIYGMGLLGIRQSSKKCSSGTDGSYLGFDCYADSDPEVGYGLNYGGMLMMDIYGLSVGARVTGESSMLVLGFSF